MSQNFLMIFKIFRDFFAIFKPFFEAFAAGWSPPEQCPRPRAPRPRQRPRGRRTEKNENNYFNQNFEKMKTIIFLIKFPEKRIHNK
jgi:hypothetical protein